MKFRVWLAFVFPLSFSMTSVYSGTPTDSYINSIKTKINHVISPELSSQNQINIQELTKFSFEVQPPVEEALPVIKPAQSQSLMGSMGNVNHLPSSQYELSMLEAINQALQHRPEISKSISKILGQGENINTAKAQYYPQISGGISTADLTSGERGRQLYTLSATQVLYDFGKIKSSVNIEEYKFLQEQANALISIDDIAYETANAIININRYKQIVHVAEQQIQGISRIAEIANLRAKAGISSQVDPIQAQSDLEAAQSNKVVQESQLKQYQQKLRTLLGYDVSNTQLTLSDNLVQNSGLYSDTDFTAIPKMMAAQMAIQIAKYEKEQTKLSAYPSINLKGSLSQALNGKNPNNNEDQGTYSSIMLEATSNFYQGGAIRSKLRSANYAEEAAKAEVSTVYLDVVDNVRLLREEIESKQKQIDVLVVRKGITATTKELYQEQYKLGTRTVIDLLNSEQAIHAVAQEIENARYDIYAGLIKYIQVTGRSRDVYNLNNTLIQGFKIEP